MILIDTSAWIEFRRDTDSTICNAVDSLLDGDIAITDAISMEVLAGARNERHLAQLRGLLARATMLPTTPVSYDDAAALHRRCRRHGQTVRKLIDCLIAAVAIDARGHDPARGCRLQRSRRAHPPADPPVVSAPRTREPRARLLGGS